MVQWPGEMGVWAKITSRRVSGCYGVEGVGAEGMVALDGTAAFGLQERTQGWCQAEVREVTSHGKWKLRRGRERMNCLVLADAVAEW